MSPRDDPAIDAALDEWVARLRAEFGDVPIDRDAILGLAGEAAHGVVRPAAPLTTFVAGYLAGRRAAEDCDAEAAVAQVVAAIRALL